MVEGRPHNKQESETNTEGKPKHLEETQNGVEARPPHIVNGDVDYDGGDHEQPSGDFAAGNFSTSVEKDAKAGKGEKTTMRSDIDDTRKIGIEDEVHEKFQEETTTMLRPLPPVTETSRDDVRPHRIQDSMPPPDVSSSGAVINGRKADSAGSPSSSSDGISSLPSTAPTSTAPDSQSQSPSQSQSQSRSRSESTSYSSKANEMSVNRNKVTTQLRKNLKEKNVYSIPVAAPVIDPHRFSDPLIDSFYKDMWLAAAVRNTQAFRKVFRCVPDDLVQTWKQYREFQTWAERHNKVRMRWRDSFATRPLTLFFNNSCD